MTARQQNNRLLLRARDAMDRDFMQPLDITYLAGVALCSPAHFIRAFRDAFGETPHRYLQRRRVERAMSLLRGTDLNVGEVWVEVGFASVSTFSPQLFVLDQDEAVAFYVAKLGFEVHTDTDLGFMRWLTVSLPADPSRQVLLERPGPPAMDPQTAEQVGDLLTKGAGGGWLALSTDDRAGHL